MTNRHTDIPLDRTKRELMTAAVDGQRYFYESQSEAEFMRHVVSYAERRGWLVYHTHDARNSAAGFPDLVMVRRRRLMFAELKREIPAKCSPSLLKKLEPTPAQVEWLAQLDRVRASAPEPGRGVETYLWRPSSWPEIEAVLL